MDYPLALKQRLITDELFDLSLYKLLLRYADAQTGETLKELIEVETKHVSIWSSLFSMRVDVLPFKHRVKLAGFGLVCKLFGTKAIHLILESIEVYAIKKYLRIWEHYKDDPAMRKALDEILHEEFQHEDQIVSGLIDQQIHPERVRNFFLGFNDGLVEITGAVGGFFAAFAHIPSILIAATTVAIAGAFSMAAGAFAATESEREIQDLESEKKAFLGEVVSDGVKSSPFSAALLVGLAYLAGASVPIVPVLFGADKVWYSIVAGVLVTSLVSYVLAFFSGMRIRRRVFINVALMLAAVAITYLIGGVVKGIWGIEV